MVHESLFQRVRAAISSPTVHLHETVLLFIQHLDVDVEPDHPDFS